MKIIALDQAGGVENLRIQEMEAPTPAPGELLVKVRATSVNPADVKLRADDKLLTAFLGKDRPAFLGWDFAGEVAGVGSAALGFRVGDGVFGLTPTARGRAYAEYVCVAADSVAHKPNNVSYEAAAVTTMAALTAWNPLVNEMHIQPGDTVLIHAGSGGVGHFAIQIAKHCGATVLTTCSARNRNFVLSLGADRHIDYTTRRFEEDMRGVDLVLDTIGGETLTRSLGVVRDGGSIITVIPFSDESLVEQARQRNVTLSFGGMRHSAEDLAALAGLLGQGILKPHLSATYAFGEMAQAHTQVEGGRTVGKVVVIL
jgi:NADPH:quinone reductase-like Zn-dependent oxidoreductase